MDRDSLTEAIYLTASAVQVVKEVAVTAALLALGYAACQIASLVGTYNDFLSLVIGR